MTCVASMGVWRRSPVGPIKMPQAFWETCQSAEPHLPDVHVLATAQPCSNQLSQQCSRYLPMDRWAEEKETWTTIPAVCSLQLVCSGCYERSTEHQQQTSAEEECIFLAFAFVFQAVNLEANTASEAKYVMIKKDDVIDRKLPLFTFIENNFRIKV